MPLFRLENVQQFATINVLADPGVKPGPVVVPNGVKVIIVWSLTSGRQGKQILGGTASGSFVVSVAAAEAMRAAIVARSETGILLGFLAPTASLLRVDMQDIRVANQPVFSSTGTAAPGTSSGTALPDEVAFAITFRTALTGPGNRGRTYIPGWSTTALAVGNVVAAPAVTAASNWMNAVAQVMSAQGLPLSLIQPERVQYTGSTGTVHPARAATMRPITSIVARDNHWDSQRRRGLK